MLALCFIDRTAKCVWCVGGASLCSQWAKHTRRNGEEKIEKTNKRLFCYVSYIYFVYFFLFTYFL